MKACKIAHRQAFKRAYVGIYRVPSNGLPYTLPTTPQFQVILDYSGLGLDETGVDILLNALADGGLCTDCMIDVSNNSAPGTSGQSAILVLEGSPYINVVVRD